MAISKITANALNSPLAGINVDGGTIKLDGNYPVGTNNVALGNASLDDGSLTGNNNVAVGGSALTANTSGSQNTAVGTISLEANTSGGNNAAVGYASLMRNTTGVNNNAIGYTALQNNVCGNNNNGMGFGALDANTCGSDNVAIGTYALKSNTTASYNTAVGRDALYENTTASNNTAVGYLALGDNSTGDFNTAIGRQAGDANTTGTYNTFLGSSSGYFMTTGSKNTILGRYNGNQGGLDIRTSSNNIVLSDGDGNRRIHVNSGGDIFLGGNNINPQDASGPGTGATTFRAGGLQLSAAVDNDTVGYFNRVRNDGPIIGFRQDGTQEGSISVSGTTVSYNGGHLARWSRLADDSKDTSIVKGTVMTNLDAMVEWGDEENEQLNKMAVSSVEGDANVAGVFVNWDEDDDWNDMNVAMTGDMVIRIASGTTVARGDLLMSAGDGTAKPQGDDIVRSKTIAKVTSTHVSHTYDDGSYLVPCVLMAC